MVILQITNCLRAYWLVYSILSFVASIVLTSAIQRTRSVQGPGNSARFGALRGTPWNVPPVCLLADCGQPWSIHWHVIPLLALVLPALQVAMPAAPIADRPPPHQRLSFWTSHSAVPMHDLIVNAVVDWSPRLQTLLSNSARRVTVCATRKRPV